MMHKKRRWCVGPTVSAEDLAEKLTGHSWTLGTGFELLGYLCLNDSTSEAGAQEYGVIRKPTEPDQPFLQVESITFGWCNRQQALDYIQQVISGTLDGSGRTVPPVIEAVAEHGPCGFCA